MYQRLLVNTSPLSPLVASFFGISIELTLKGEINFEVAVMQRVHKYTQYRHPFDVSCMFLTSSFQYF